MTAVRTRNKSFKIVATLSMVLLMAFFSACEILATEGARDAIAGGRELREFEDETLRPIENEMNDLWVNDIEPREREMQILQNELRRLEEELLGPLWAAQNDPWAAGGDASVLQAEFDAKNREYELMQRALDLEQRELDAEWQVLWTSNTVDPEYQALEDERNAKQRELDRLYRFGNRPIDDIWDQINELNASQGFASTDSQIESERINIELRRLWDLLDEINNSNNDEVNALYKKAELLQNELNDLYNFGWNPINEIYHEIDQLESDLNAAGVSSSGSLVTEIAELEDVKASYVQSRDNELEAWYATLSELETTTTTSTTGASAERIAELQNLIADLDHQVAEQLAALNAEIADIEQDIIDHKATYDKVIADDIGFLVIRSADRLAAVDALEIQIEELEELDDLDEAEAVANANQIADLESQKAALIAEDDADEAAVHAANEGLEAERDAGVADYELAILAKKSAIDEIPSDETTALKVEYQAELESLSAADIQASIEATESHWNTRIDEIVIKVATLQNELIVGSTADDSIDSRINSLRLQAAEMEKELNAKIANLEATVNELYNQANNSNGSDSGQTAEIQTQIDVLNDQLEDIWTKQSSNGLEILIQVQALEKQVRVLEEEREEEQYRLEEELWDIDGLLSDFYNGQNSDYQVKERAYQTIADDLNKRRFELDELRWTAGIEQQDAWDALNSSQNEAGEQIKLIEQEQLGAIKSQIREIEDSLQDFYDQRRDLENKLRDAQNLVDQKQRELEDAVFDALESAAGTVDEAGDTVLTATEESVPDTNPNGVSADGSAN